MRPTNRNEPYEHPNGQTYVFKRSYNARLYNHDFYLTRGINAMIFKDLFMAASLSKAKCLKEADREVDTPMFAIEKDEDYLGDFKTCVATNVNAALAERNAVIAQRKEELLKKGKPANGAIEFTLPEDRAESMIDGALDAIKLSELREHDHNLYKAFKSQLEAKAAGGADE